jgi:glycosyltransferase involved in cell wall biosynthesis
VSDLKFYLHDRSPQDELMSVRPQGVLPCGENAAVPTIVVASVMRAKGGTGMQTHCRAFLDVLRNSLHPCALITPFDALRWQAYAVFGLRKPIHLLSSSASVWWYRHWHEHFLAQALRRYLRDDNRCVIYAQCPPSARAALGVRRSSRQRVVMAVHFNLSQADEWVEKGMISLGGDLYESIRNLEKHVLPQLDGLVYVSDFMRRELLLRIPAIEQVPYVVLPNFVDDPGVSESDAFDADLITIGSLEPRKNQAYLLDIVAAAKRQGTLLSITIAGDGPDRANLKAHAHRLGVDDLVRFLGFVPDAPRLLRRHRAYIHGATMENMPLTLIESLSYGVPVFAPAVGGIPEIFEDGVEGCMLPLDNADAAARRVLEWLASPATMRNAGDAARLRYLLSFESTTVGARLADFLNSIDSDA